MAIVDDDRAALAQRIEQRFDTMVAAGFVAEVERLRARADLTAELPALRAVGYRQIWRYLAGDIAWDEARRTAIVATRQLAKRQMTWLRSERNLATVAWSDSRRMESALAWMHAELERSTSSCGA
jgi:tRNA dimethylallyltransferase